MKAQVCCSMLRKAISIDLPCLVLRPLDRAVNNMEKRPAVLEWRRNVGERPGTGAEGRGARSLPEEGGGGSQLPWALGNLGASWASYI